MSSASFDALLLELPQHLDLMASRLENGENIYSVFARQAQAQGDFARLLSRVALRLEYGQPIDQALDSMAQEGNSVFVAELANKLNQSIRRGTPIASQVSLLAQSVRNQLRISQLKRAGKNELLMLIPLVFLILPVTVAFAIFPSLQLLQVGF